MAEGSKILGSGLAKAAADVLSLRKQYNREVIDSGETLSFAEWLKKKGIKNPAIPSTLRDG